MELTIQAIEKVMEETGLEYKAAKALLEENECDPEKAVTKFFEEEPEDEKKEENGEECKENTADFFDKIQELIDKGNVDRIQLRKDDQIVMSVPVNVGIVGGLIGAIYAPGMLVLGALASFGFGCKIEVVSKDGKTDVIN